VARPSGTTARKPGTDPAFTLQQAFAAFQHGRAADCVGLCETILARRAGDPVALHLLGAARHRLGDVQGAVHALTRAATLDPRNAEVHANLGAALRAAGNAAAAIESLRRAVALRPDAVPARYNLGNALAQLGRHEEAIAAYRNAVTLDPAHAPAYNNLGLALKAVGRREESVAAWRRSVAVQPAQRDAHLNFGRALLEAGNAEDALFHFDAALKAAPGDPDLHSERGVALLELDRIDEAVAALRAAVSLNPGHCDARINLGSALCLAGRADQGAAEFTAALAAGAEDADTLSNLGAALDVVGSRDNARDALSRALALAPDHADALNNMGESLRNEGRFEEAIACYDRALTGAADHPVARFGRATARLAIGRFAAGWRDYLARPSMAQPRGHHRTPLPASLAGAHVLVEGDQGLGDEIFFLRFIGRLGERGARVSYRPDPRLAAMLRRAALFDCVLAPGAASEPADFRIAVGDLPFLLGHDDATPLPPSVRLSPLPKQVADMRERLGTCGPPPYLGLSWRAGTRDRRRALFKEVPSTAFAALRGVDGTWVALQRAPDPDELDAVAAALQAPLHDLSALNSELESMLALVGLLDDYVCVSNTNIHLAAARERACRILVPNPPEFRWMAAGDESPWFPGMRTYRQAVDGDWTGAFAALARDLEDTFRRRMA
jgi:Flp pilus assembly protein TadD